MFYGILAALAAMIVGLDQWTKWLTVTHIPSTNGSAVVKAIPGFFHITHIKNTGAAWSMLEGQTWLFVLVTAVFFVILGVLIWKKVLQKRFELVCLAMIAGGALGNLIDRVVSVDAVGREALIGQHGQLVNAQAQKIRQILPDNCQIGAFASQQITHTSVSLCEKINPLCHYMPS